jgi:hypothetical protein
MKKIVLVAMLFISASAAAQHYRKFLFALDVGMPNSKLKPAGLFTMEPAYRVNDKIAIGFRMETVGFVSTIGGNNLSLSSMGINGHYYFDLPVRTFCGLGIGLYNPSNNFIMSNTETQSQRNGLGIYPRIGLEFGHARLTLEYNFIQNMNDYVSPEFNPMMPLAQGHYEIVNKSYLSLKIGFFIGGGKKKVD